MKTSWLVSLYIKVCFLGLLWVFLIHGLIRAAPLTDQAAIVTSSLAPDKGRLLVDIQGLPPASPALFSASAEQTFRFDRDEITGEGRLNLHLIQGRVDRFTLELSSQAEIVDVSGSGLQDWSVRQTVGPQGIRRFLDLRAHRELKNAERRDFSWIIRTRVRLPADTHSATLPLINAGDAIGFHAQLQLINTPFIKFRVKSSHGLVGDADKSDPAESTHFVSSGHAQLELTLFQSGAFVSNVELIDPILTGVISANEANADFHLRAQVRASKTGARIRVLIGRAALVDHGSGDGWHLELASTKKDNISYDLVADRAGLLSVDVAFAAQVIVNGDWRTFDFAVPAGSAVPFVLDGLPEETLFKADAPIVPLAAGKSWKGFLPSDGSAAVAWKQSHSSVEGALFFTTDALTDIAVEAGALRQSSQITVRILQGKLSHLQLNLAGTGEILGVNGTNIVDWKVAKNSTERVLNVEFSLPIQSSETVTILSQTEIKPHPATVEPLRITPDGAVRHSGFIRIFNRGAVRAEITHADGLLQLAPNQFPAPSLESDPTQVLVYRFPSALYSYRVSAKRIQAEVSVSFVATYTLTDTDRGLDADVELDVREAALREWSFQIPDDYSVTNVSGNGIADYNAESQSTLGFRNVRILFSDDVQGRQLLKVRLEKTQPAAAGDWSLPPLRFPNAKNVHGNIAVSLAPGFRIASADISQLTEIPLSYFPKQTAGLQQAWRLRSSDWSATLRLEALAQSVQADVFHLYTIKEGVVEGSILFNYFVVGAPVTEWKIQVPATIGNIDVVGENVRRDWRREGDHLVVALQRPALGAFTLLLTFEQPIGAVGGTIKPAEVRPLNVQSERGYIDIVSSLQIKKDSPIVEGTGLLPLDVMELPSEFRLLSDAPALASYQYSTRPFSLELGFQWHQAAETADQVVDYAKLSSVISRDGQIVTDGQYYVKTRGAKLLRLQLPASAKLWETRVDNALVTVRLDGSQIIIPLPGRANPNEPAHIQIRFGQVNEASGTRIKLTAPRPSSPVVLSEWILHGDVGRQLVFRGGGNGAVVPPELTPTGFEWLSQQGLIGLLAVLILVAGGVFFLRNPAGWSMLLGFMFSAGSMAELAALLASSQIKRVASLPELAFTSTLLANTQDFVVEAANVSTRLDINWPGAFAVIAGLGFAAFAVYLRKKRPNSATVIFGFGLLCVATGLLAQRGGASWFLGAGASGVLVYLTLAALTAWKRQPEMRQQLPDLPGGRTLLLLLAGVGVLTIGPKAPARAESSPVVQPWIQEGIKPAEAIVQKWEIRGERIYAEGTITVRGVPGDSFLLLRPPALLAEFVGEGLRVGKEIHAGETRYYITPEREGVLTGHFRFEMPLKDRSQELPLPTGTAAIERISLSLDQAGWEFASRTAVQITAEKEANAHQSGAQIVFAPQSVSSIQLRPKQRDVGAEKVRFFAESANLYEPGQGVVNGRTRFTVRPVQGRVSELLIDVPLGLTIADVKNGPVGIWRFDPEKHQLRIAVEPAQTQVFTIDVEDQLSTSALPFDISLQPLRVSGAAGGGGTLALAFGNDTQPEGVHVDALSEATIFDFDATLLPPDLAKESLVTIQKVWRYGPEGGQVNLRVAAVEPEVRVFAKQILSFDDDRLLMSVDLNVSIARAGLFQLTFPLPEGLEVEGLTGSNLSQWTETTEHSQRLITLQFTGKTVGEQTFALTLTGPAPRTQAAWKVPSILIREATRQTGVDLLVSGQGLRLSTVAREKATQLDPHELGGLQPGSLAFKLLQADAAVTVSIEALDPWITVQSLEEVTLREGQTLTRLAFRYRVENAGVKTMRVRLPEVSEEGARTVHVSGGAVSSIVKRAGSTDEWEIGFQHAIVGDTDVQIEYQETRRENEQEAVRAPVFTGARQVAQYMALRGSGRIELEAKDLPTGWSRLDWSAVPTFLQNRNDRSEPALSFRASEPAVVLEVAVRRHGLADAMKLQVTEANLTTLISTQQGSLTAVDLKMNVLEKTLFKIRLPKNHQLINMAVNGSSVAAVREGDTYSLYVAANTTGDSSARVRIIYSLSRDGSALTGPALTIPMENVTWRVIIPPGYRMTRHGGDFVLRGTPISRTFGLEEYQTLTASTRSVDAEKGIAFLDAANKWLQKGDQQKAGELFSRAAATSGLDDASNEDARVQLRKLKTEQAELGLNTRRQRLYLDNRWGAGARNEQLELAATLNPFMRGAVNFDPQQFDQIIAGNTVDENEGLKNIAARLVDQQLSNQIPPNQIDLSLPERGTIATFTQSLRMGDNVPLSIDLKLKPVNRVNWLAIVGPLLGIAAVAGLGFAPREKKIPSA